MEHGDDTSRRYGALALAGLAGISIGYIGHGYINPVQELPLEPMSPYAAAPANDSANTSIERPRTTNAERDSQSQPGQVSINEASAAELEQLPGIGPVLAKRIVELRGRLGGYRSIDELLEVKGIGEKTLAKMRPFLRL